MTEDELKTLETDIFAEVMPDPDIERQWLKDQLEISRKQEQQLMALFRLQKFIRDDAQMAVTHQSILRTRKTLGYIEKRLEELAT